MSHNYVCYRCGGSLSALSLPFSRRDECPQCENYLHVCRMCRHYDRDVPRQCREDDADDVKEKEQLNFCDYFEPAGNAFDAAGKKAADRAAAELDALFGDAAADDAGAPDDDALSDAEKLFR
ncbi:MAG: hypothetical protein R3288_16345 [Woeseiaceae bacterium]|nr:hypothetical protein [Woeseiaceae bacterium]